MLVALVVVQLAPQLGERPVTGVDQHAAIEEAAAVDALLADVVTGVRSVPPLVVAGVDTDVERVAADSWKTRSPGLSWLRLRCLITEYCAAALCGSHLPMALPKT